MSSSYKVLLVCLILCFTFFNSQAQRGNWRNVDPEERAQRQTIMMVDSLALSEAQTSKVAEVNLKYSKMMADAREDLMTSENPDWSTIRNTMRHMQEERKKEMVKYLTAEQYEQWKKIEEAQIQRRRDRGRNGTRGKGRKGDKENTKPSGN